MYVKKVL